MNKVLIIQTAFLGDVILATPVVAELHRLYPEAKIDFVVKKGNQSLLANNPKIDHVFIFNKSEGKVKALRSLLKDIRKEKYDLVINLHRFGSSGILAGLSKGKKIIGFKKNPFSFLYNQKFDHKIGDGTHEVERNLSLLKDLGASLKVRPELFPSNEDKSAVRNYQKGPYFCLAPASVWYTKQLPQEKWIELINRFDADKSVYLLGGPDDYELCERIKSSVNSDQIINLCGKLTLLQSAALMSGAKRNYVNDSGPLHLASSMNAPVTAFFCSTVPDFGFGPLSDDSSVKEVENLACRPCGLHGHKDCPKSHFDCGAKMDVLMD